MKLFSISGDQNATNIFNFLIGGGGENQIEWGHVKSERKLPRRILSGHRTMKAALLWEVML